MDLNRLRIDRSGGSKVRARPPGGGLGKIVLLGLVALAALGVYTFRRPLLERVDRLRLPTVRVARVTETRSVELTATQGIAANGYVVAARRAALSADTPGRITELAVREGQLVEAGQLVARLYDEELKAALRRAEAEVQAAEAGHAGAEAALRAAELDAKQLASTKTAADHALEAAKAERQLAIREHDRALEQLARGIGTPRERDRTEAAMDQTAAGVRRAEALVEAAQQGADSARVRLEIGAAEVAGQAARVTLAEAARDQTAATLSKTEVRAPFRGIVVLKDAEVGEVVSPNVQGGANARGSVVTMVDFESLEVQADVPESTIKEVRLGGAARVFLDAYPDRGYEAVVERIWPTANRQKATIEVRVGFRERDDRLRPDMGVRIVFLPEGARVEGDPAPGDGESDGAPKFLIPADAVITQGGARGVFLLQRDVATFQQLQLGDEQSGKVPVLDGLDGGERLVLAPPPTLNDGDRVQVEE